MSTFLCSNTLILFGTMILLCSLADQKGQGQSDEPIVTRNEYMQPTLSAGKPFEPITIMRFAFTSDWLITWREIFQPIKHNSMENQASWKSLLMFN